jgi:AraC family transcriptional regulator
MHQIYAQMTTMSPQGHRGQHHKHTVPVRHVAAVHSELSWRLPEVDVEHSGRQVVASYFSAQRETTRDYVARNPRGYYVASLFMRTTQLVLSTDAGEIQRGELRSGSFLLSAQGQTLRAQFDAPCEILHLYLSEAFMRRMAEASDGLHLLGGLGSAGLCQDDAIAQLGRALLAADDKMCGWQYAERVAAAMVSRYFHLLTQSQLTDGQPRRIALPRWRLQRVREYVQLHLGQTITLSDMATAASLSPMHFAAQFRIATGQRPHDYLLTCRIDRAKTLLATTDRALIDIALDVGFCTQAHFTTVFKRFTGTTPSLWRRHNYRPASFTSDAPRASAEILQLHPSKND